MNQAPSVFVPTTPEGDGITVPTILSVLVHGLIVGFIIYTNQTPDLDVPTSIETTMVSPEQLAEIQGQILANREAAMAQMPLGDDGSVEMTSAANSDYISSSQGVAGPSGSTQVPVFIPSNDAANSSDDGLLFDREQKLRIQAANEEYQRKMAELAEQIDREAMEDLDSVRKNEIERARIEQARLEALKKIENTSPMIKPPVTPERKTGRPGSSSGQQNIDFASAGESTAPSGPSSPRGGGGGSKGISNGEVLSKIRSNYSPPAAAAGSRQETKLTITVDANGDVASVRSSGTNEAVNKAAEDAVWRTGRFPIDTDDPKYPTFNVTFIGRN